MYRVRQGLPNCNLVTIRFIKTTFARGIDRWHSMAYNGGEIKREEIEMNWTKPYCDVTHLGNIGDEYWATVTDWTTFATLTRWYPGCQFHPLTSTHNTVDEARQYAEDWLSGQNIAEQGMVSAINTRKEV